ncbi:MAG: YdcF family protein [Gallionellaceae bacterium]
MIILALVVFYLLCTGIGANLLVRPLENLTAPLASSSDAHAQAIVVLAAGRLEHAVEYGGKDIPDYIALARLRYAAKLQHETGLPILVSGGNVAQDGTGASKADAMASALREDFATPVRWIEGTSANTAENARFSSKILRQNGVHRILLVTDAMHMPRAKMVFSRTGLDVVVAPTMFFGARSNGPFAFLPSAEGFRRSYYAIYEWLGLVWYWALYGDSA